MPVYIVYTLQQLNNLIPRLAADFRDNRWIHICTLHHGDINCSEHTRRLQTGQMSTFTMVYIPNILEQSIRNILNQLIEDYRYDDDNDEDDDNNNLNAMMMCPVCGLPFTEQ